VSMKQILKCQAKRQQSSRRVKKLEHLVQVVKQEMVSPQEFQEKLQAILDADDFDHPADDSGGAKSDDVTYNLSNPEAILEQAKQYIAQLETGEAVACAAANKSTEIAAQATAAIGAADGGSAAAALDDVNEQTTEVSESMTPKEMLVT